MGKKLLDFQASISDVVQVNPLFSTCRVRVLYTGKNRNMSIITKEAVERAMPTLKNIPIVGEFSEAVEDYKGHGGTLDLDSYKYIHTTKPYGVVPESATYSWETVRGMDGSLREYLTIEGCYLWTGRYEEAYSIVENGKGQSMEIEITDGQWNQEQEAYQIDNYVYSALCILGDDVEPAFENANITSYSLKDDSFKKEFSTMLSELDTSLTNEKEVNEEMIKKLLEKYSTTMEALTEKGLNFAEIDEADLEAKIAEALGVEFEVVVKEQDAVEVMKEIKEEQEKQDAILAGVGTETKVEAEVEQPKKEEAKAEQEVVVTKEETKEQVANAGDTEEIKIEEEVKVEEADKVEAEKTEEFKLMEARIVDLEAQLVELDTLKEFKLNIEKADHEEKAQKLFKDFQFTEEDVKGLDIHNFSLNEIEEKCYMIFGRKSKNNKNFSKNVQEKESIHVPLVSENKQERTSDGYGGLLDAVKEKQ